MRLNQQCICVSYSEPQLAFFGKNEVTTAVLCICDDKMRSKEKKRSGPSGISEKFLLVVDYQVLFTSRNMAISVFKLIT